MKIESGRDDRRGDDAHQDGREYAGDAGENEENGEDAEADCECRPDG